MFKKECEWCLYHKVIRVGDESDRGQSEADWQSMNYLNALMGKGTRYHIYSFVIKGSKYRNRVREEALLV